MVQGITAVEQLSKRKQEEPDLWRRVYGDMTPEQVMARWRERREKEESIHDWAERNGVPLREMEGT